MKFYRRFCDYVEDRSPKLGRLLARPGTRQLVRYIFAGFCVTQFAALIYSGQVYFLGVEPLTANVVSTACGLLTGYFVHSRWSFATGSNGNEGLQVGRFLLASFFAFMVNTMWVWLLVKTLHLPALAPVPLMMLATPWISFLLNRHWVFKPARDSKRTNHRGSRPPRESRA
jgi:putative flippase GtrA